MEFDIYAFADYSGAAKASTQHKAIAWSVYDRTKSQRELITGLTRQTLQDAVHALLRQATNEGKRVIFGFDHCYSFPQGFYEAIHRKPWRHWRELVSWFHHDLAKLTPLDQDVNPRAWATAINQWFVARDGLAIGPFWGPNFIPLTRQFTYGIPISHVSSAIWHERRLVEERMRTLKNIYQLGGAGSVGLQSLFGIYHLYELLTSCEAEHIPVHVWPYDGWSVASKAHHVLIEVYATLYLGKSTQKRTDQGDAIACTTWAMEQDEAGHILTYLDKHRLSLTEEEEQRVQLEGWVLGV